MAARLAKFGLALAAIAAIVAVVILIGRRPAEVAADAPAAAPQKIVQTSPPDPPFADPYQRSVAIYTFHKAAASGPDRGREIFYYKCWFCHNEFADGAPKLKGVFQHKQLLYSLDVANRESCSERAGVSLCLCCNAALS